MSEATSRSPYLTLDTKALVDALTAQNNPPLYTLSPAAARRVLTEAQSRPVDKPDADIRDLDLPVGPTGTVPVRIVRPKNATGALPLIFYMHGGGWILGDKDTHDRLVRELAVGAKAVVVFPGYTPSPEAQYPTAIEQSYAVLSHVVENAGDFDVDPGKVAVAGDSVGGNMATVMALLSKERHGPKITVQLLFYPVTDADFNTASYEAFADGPWLTRQAMQWFWEAYLPEEQRRHEITASPLWATVDQLRDLPPALVLTAENDVLRDEGEAYARKLVEAGVQVACLRCNGTHHDFMMLNALADTAPTRAAIALAVATLRRCLR